MCRDLRGPGGTNLFYIDPSARYLIVGRIYDMETHQDLTAARLLAINPDMLVGAAAPAQARAARACPTHPQSVRRRFSAGAEGEPCQPSRNGPSNGASTPAPLASPSSAISTAAMPRCTRPSRPWACASPKRPISILGTRAISESVICAEDKAAAVERA
jgi:thiol:disulfide interchange protein DsbC